MGIFDFVKNAGEKIFNGGEEEGDAEANEKSAERREGKEILRFIRDMGLPVEDTKVAFDEGVATVSGKAESTKVKENIILAVGNIEGVARVDDRMTVEKTEPESTFYTVEKGDTLSKIAEEHYGDAMRYDEIFEANRPMLKDPDRIYPGQELRIPRG